MHLIVEITAYLKGSVYIVGGKDINYSPNSSQLALEPWNTLTVVQSFLILHTLHSNNGFWRDPKV